jgi:hypothetical protein
VGHPGIERREDKGRVKTKESAKALKDNAGGVMA